MADYFKITLEEGEGVYVELQNVFDAEVSYNGGDWEEAFDIYFENEGDYALVRAEMPDGWGANEAKLKINEEFGNIGTFSIEGNIMSLICGSQIEEMTDEEIAELEIPEYCFKGIFKAEEGAESRILDASGLVLPTLTLANNCYEEMFADQLIEHLPELPATTLADYCYSGMFRGCSLQDESKVPELPTMQLAPYCYYEMFSGGYLNGSDVILPATTLEENCYQNMFSDANWLRSVEIRGTTLADDCFSGMFQGIESFYYITASMTSQQLASGTYTNDWMLDATPHIYTTTDPNFDTSITRGPSTIPDGCSIVVLQPAIHFKELFINGKQVKELFINGKEVKLAPPPTPYDGLKFTATQANSSVTLNKNGSPTTLNLEFSMDNGSTWQTFNTGTTYALANVGDSICIRAPEGSPNLSGTAQGSGNRHTFSLVGKIAASGNLMSLYDCDGETTAMTDYGFCKLFQSCTALTTAPELLATTLASNCYYLMFKGCSALTTTPELPVTTLASYCYRDMFNGCTSLTAAPELPATTLTNSCYYLMFRDCTSLTSAPELPATTLATSCYSSMFQGCTALTTAPELPATTLVSKCYYQMFYGCFSLNYLKTALPVSEVKSTSNHSSWLFSVGAGGTYESTDPNFDETLITTRSGDTIPASWNVVKPAMLKLTSKQAGSTVALNRNGNPATLHLEMSRNGTTWTPFVVDYTYDIGGNNDYILLRAPASQPNTNGTAQSSTNYHQFTMTGNVEAGGNIMALYSSEGGNAMTSYGFYQLFRGCTSLAQMPKLPATELAQHCYDSMFRHCTALTETTMLPAKNLRDGSYHSMFFECTNLNAVYAGFKTFGNSTDYWLTDVASTGTFYYTHSEFNPEIARSSSTVPTGWTLEYAG